MTRTLASWEHGRNEVIAGMLLSATAIAVRRLSGRIHAATMPPHDGLHHDLFLLRVGILVTFGLALILTAIGAIRMIAHRRTPTTEDRP